MITRLKNKLKNHLANIPGWRTNRKIVVIESDDWGALRMPSIDAYHKLKDWGVHIDGTCYNRLDALESKLDLHVLFDTLAGYKDIKGNHPVMTFNTVMGNPDYDQIKEIRFEQYIHQPLSKTYDMYNGENLFSLWKEGMSMGLVQPQFHAREHLNVSLWMKALKDQDRDTRLAFDQNTYGLRTSTPSKHQRDYLAAYWAEGVGDLEKKEAVIKDGLLMFEKIFGFKSKTFIACNYVFPSELEQVLTKCGVTTLQGQRGHLAPDPISGLKRTERNYTGKRTRFGLKRTVRNCFFEPAFDKNQDWVKSCIQEMSQSFFWGKPAIISAHRVNFVGGLDEGNRQYGNEQLNKLLKKALERWPRLEFMSSDQLAKLVSI